MIIIDNIIIINNNNNLYISLSFFFNRFILPRIPLIFKILRIKKYLMSDLRYIFLQINISRLN